MTFKEACLVLARMCRRWGWEDDALKWEAHAEEIS